MSGLASKSVLVADHGLFIHVAMKLAESFGTVFYWTPWVGTGGYPYEAQRMIGTGIPNVHRVMDFWSTARDVDLVVFPDVYFHDETAQLRAMGKPVWGSGYAGALEVERARTKALMQAHGMNVVPYELIRGGDALREYLADKDEAWIKASTTRGDWETMHWEGAHLSGRKLEKRIAGLGPRAATKEFIVEPPIKACEFGYDGFCVDGQFPGTALYGVEIKNEGYVGRVMPFVSLPTAIYGPTMQFGELMGRLGMRGFFSDEIRILTEGTESLSKGTPFLIDPAMRCGSPPSECYIELFSNWAEVIWAGANGELVDLEPVARYAAQIVLKSRWVEDDFLPVDFPEELTPFVKLHNFCILDGRVTVVPQDFTDEFPEFGSVIGFGDTQEEAQRAALDHAREVKALDLEYANDVFDDVEDCLKEAESVGITF